MSAPCITHKVTSLRQLELFPELAPAAPAPAKKRHPRQPGERMRRLRPIALPIVKSTTIQGIATECEMASRRYGAMADALGDAGHDEAAQDSSGLETYWRLRSLELWEAEACALGLPAPDAEVLRQATIRLAADFARRAPGKWLTVWNSHAQAVRAPARPRARWVSFTVELDRRHRAWLAEPTDQAHAAARPQT